MIRFDEILFFCRTSDYSKWHLWLSGSPISILHTLWTFFKADQWSLIKVLETVHQMRSMKIEIKWDSFRHAFARWIAQESLRALLESEGGENSGTDKSWKLSWDGYQGTGWWGFQRDRFAHTLFNYFHSEIVWNRQIIKQIGKPVWMVEFLFLGLLPVRSSDLKRDFLESLSRSP